MRPLTHASCPERSFFLIYLVSHRTKGESWKSASLYSCLRLQYARIGAFFHNTDFLPLFYSTKSIDLLALASVWRHPCNLFEQVMNDSQPYPCRIIILFYGASPNEGIRIPSSCRRSTMSCRLFLMPVEKSSLTLCIIDNIT